MMKPAIITMIGMSVALSGCVAISVSDNSASTTEAAADHHDYPEARSYAVSDDPMAEVDAALARAAELDTRLLLVMGANWCHDSRALAGWLGTERFQALVEGHYELVFVNVGLPQSGDGHNLEIGQRFGHEQEGTPNVLVVTPEGMLVNGDTASTWRNSASRSEDAIYEELNELAHRPAGIEPVEGIEIAAE
ncbi:thioredoxin family protein [Aurantiacibacter sp. D1-12]|uniref:thioredoxin family protein n=1 Tax=Aurantiacibacter sp. D1-12 TaxID=2993658 RepID=UPI00237CBF82|nr:thioredoxin family protein [Aurantiacibacter sp. D1-12]MDE1467194.1 thioredoxin family protein [Aurantiacibacter sp. D1-12]